jgi:hypothetical protein
MANKINIPLEVTARIQDPEILTDILADFVAEMYDGHGPVEEYLHELDDTEIRCYVFCHLAQAFRAFYQV